MRFRFGLLLAAVLLAVVRTRALGQTGDSGARLERLAEGVYAIIHQDATEDWPNGNTGVVIGDRGVLVIDSNYLPSRARADLALIRSVTDKPIRYLVNTHWHYDHNNGNAVYRTAFPDVAIVAHRETRRLMTVNGPRWFQTVTAAESPQRKRLAALESALAAGRDSTGPLSAEGRASLEKNIAQRKAEQAELGATAAVVPDLTFDRELVLRLGNREVQIRNWGRGNTPGDATIYLPAERILFAGDLLVHPVPYAYNSTPIEWIAVLSQLERLPVTGLVPGHGPVMKDHQYTRQVRELLEFVVGEVEKLATNGKTLPQIQQSLELGAYRPRFVGTSPIDQLVWDDSIRRALIERAWLGWRGGN